MSDNLCIDLNAFKSLPQKQQLYCLYENQVKTLELVKGYKFYYKLASIIGGFLILGEGILFKFHLNS